MKHAGAAALGRVEEQLSQLRAVEGLVERKPGVFYRRSRAFLHFHEDPTGLYADVRLASDSEFLRLPVNTTDEWATLLREVRKL